MFSEDLRPFLNVADFAIEATWNGTTIVRGIFDRTYLESLGDNVVAGSHPVFTCDADAVEGVAAGDTIVIDSITYKVRGIEPDGTGIVLLRLEAQ